MLIALDMTHRNCKSPHLFRRNGVRGLFCSRCGRSAHCTASALPAGFASIWELPPGGHLPSGSQRRRH